MSVILCLCLYRVSGFENSKKKLLLACNARARFKLVFPPIGRFEYSATSLLNIVSLSYSYCSLPKM